MRKKKLHRDLEIHMAREWGESNKSIAGRHKISVHRVKNVVAERRHIAQSKIVWCARCRHPSDMHHTDDWEYERGPCAAYLCDCPAMVPEHD